MPTRPDLSRASRCWASSPCSARSLTVAAVGRDQPCPFGPGQRAGGRSRATCAFEDRDDGAVVDPRGRGPPRRRGVRGRARASCAARCAGFARTRHLENLGPEAPFRLAAWSDGRLTLDDPATGQHVELLAFGPTNAGVFARLLEAAK